MMFHSWIENFNKSFALKSTGQFWRRKKNDFLRSFFWFGWICSFANIYASGKRQSRSTFVLEYIAGKNRDYKIHLRSRPDIRSSNELRNAQRLQLAQNVFLTKIKDWNKVLTCQIVVDSRFGFFRQWRLLSLNSCRRNTTRSFVR